MSKAVRLRLRRAKKTATAIAAPVPDEIAKAMRHHAETGEWPEGTRPAVVEVAERLKGASEAMAKTVTG